MPEAGFQLDTFPVSGLPRRPSAAQVRAAWRASAAPAHCLRILRRRRPDVVLGGGGFVAGPMVLAARIRGIPAALTEADAHLGLANRLAAPFARRLFLAYAIPGQRGAKVRVVGRPIPEAHRGSTPEEGSATVRASPTGRSSRSSARSQAHDRSTRWRSRRGATRGRTFCTSAESATTTTFATVSRGWVRAAAADRSLRRRARGRGACRVTRGRHRVGAGRGRDARDSRPVPIRNGGSPDAQRAPLRAGRGRDRSFPTPRSTAFQGSSTELLGDPTASRRCATRCSRSRGPTPPT